MAGAQVQVILAGEKVPQRLHVALQQTGATTSFWALTAALPEGALPDADAVVVVVPDDTAPLAGPLRVLFDRLAERPRAMLVLTSSGQPATPLAHPSTLPVTFDRGLDEHDLAVQLGTLRAMRTSLDSLQQRVTASRRNGEGVAQRYARQLRLASQVQREFLPESLPRLGPVRFDVVFCPVDYVSGDIYDVQRLDEEHVGIAVADATGHGIPAALLTVYIKRALRGKEIEHGSYRILSPAEVLTRLNDDILDAHLSECPFVAAVYAILNTRTLELTLARGGAPYPLLRRADGEVRVLTCGGGVVGVLPEPRFETATVQMRPGDSLLLYSDGLEQIVAPQCSVGGLSTGARQEVQRSVGESLAVAAAGADEPGAWASDADTGTATLVAECEPATDDVAIDACAVTAYDPVLQSRWLRTLGEQGVAAALQQVQGRQRALRRMGYPLDDLTVLTVHIAS